VASTIVLATTKVPPNRAADTRAATTPPSSAGKAMPTAWTTNATNSRSGWDQHRPHRAKSAEDGMAARPTSTHAPLPIQPGEVCPIAATRNVPAMM